MKRTRITRKRVLLFGGAVLLLAWIVYMFLPDPVPVQTATVTRGLLEVVVEEEGETGVEDHFIVTSPVAAFVRRITLEPGDSVAAGQAIVRLEPPRIAILDPLTRTQADARVAAAKAALGQAEVIAELAAAEHRRMERLLAVEAATRQAVELAAAEAGRAGAALEAARAELAAAEAGRRTGAGVPALPVADSLLAPASGRILAVHRPSGGQVMPGEPLIELAETDKLHVVASVLSQDAVRILAGTRVLLEQWGGEGTLEAVVRRIDPQGFVRVSALGVEERRVRVIADLVSAPAEFAGLGPGYRVLARFIVWHDENALRVPTAALFRHDAGWAAFTVNGQTAQLRQVEIGREAGLTTQVLSGLAEGETVIVHPGTDVRDGVRIKP